MIEHYLDKLMNVKTGGDQQGFNKSYHYHRYEPTPYSALEDLFDQYQLQSTDRIVDFGCGKGRLNFFINYLYDATVIGVEMNQEFYDEALENREHYINTTGNSLDKIQFLNCLAEDYQVNPLDNIFYFFNPFSVEIFMNVINKILHSIEKSNREIDLILYYASEEYIYYLENSTSFEMKEEVILHGLYEQNPYEKFVIYRLDI